jgi:hypothetical protein
MDRYSFTGGEQYEVPPSRKRRWGAFTGSLILHACIGGILSVWQELDNAGLLRSHEKTLEEQIREAKKTMLYYPPAIRKLPDVSPKASRRVTQEAKSIPDEQMIRISAPRRTLNTDQFIRVPVPQIKQQQALPSPNIVVVQQAVVAPPPPPAPAPKPAPPKPFVPPTAKGPSATPSRTIEAITQQPALLTMPPPGGSQAAPHIPTGQQFLPPPPVPGTGKKASKVDIADAAPTVNGSAAGSPGGNSPLATTIIISTAPVPGAPPPKPEGNRNARIAIGGESGTGSNRSPAPAGGVTAPGVVVRSTAPPGAGAPGGVVTTPTKPPTLPGEVAPRIAPPNVVQSVSIPQRPGARQLPPQVEAVFQGRVVYSTAIQTASTQADWVMWFAEPASAPPAVGRIVMRPPVPEKGTLPEELPGMPAKTWIAAKVRKNGVLTDLVFLDGTKAPQAMLELGKWMFYPAVRNGQQVDVDVVMEASWR